MITAKHKETGELSYFDEKMWRTYREEGIKIMSYKRHNVVDAKDFEQVQSQ